MISRLQIPRSVGQPSASTPRRPEASDGKDDMPASASKVASPNVAAGAAHSAARSLSNGRSPVRRDIPLSSRMHTPLKVGKVVSPKSPSMKVHPTSTRRISHGSQSFSAIPPSPPSKSVQGLAANLGSPSPRRRGYSTAPTKKQKPQNGQCTVDDNHEKPHMQRTNEDSSSKRTTSLSSAPLFTGNAARMLHPDLQISKSSDPLPGINFHDHVHEEASLSASSQSGLFSQHDIKPKLKPYENLPSDKNPTHVIERLREDPLNAEFVYCLGFKVDELIPLNPYHIMVVSPTEATNCPDGFYTISSHGVSKFARKRDQSKSRKGKQTVCSDSLGSQDSFTNLDQWFRESAIFNSLVMIPVFRQFKFWKSFLSWKREVKQNKYNKAKHHLENYLFQASVHWSVALHKITISLQEFRANTATCIDRQRSLDLVQVSELYQSLCSQVNSASYKLMHTISGICADHCGSSIAMLGDELDNDSTTRQGQTNFKYTIKAKFRLQHERNWSFCRLAECMLFQTLFETGLAIQSELFSQVQSLHQSYSALQFTMDTIEIGCNGNEHTNGGDDDIPPFDVSLEGGQASANGQNTNGFLNVYIALDVDEGDIGDCLEMHIQPSEEDVWKEFSCILDLAASSLSLNSSRILTDPVTREHTYLFEEASTSAMSKGTNFVCEMVTSSLQFNHIKESLRDLLVDAFSLVAPLKKSLAPWLAMIRQDIGLTPEVATRRCYEVQDGSEENQNSLPDDHYSEDLKPWQLSASGRNIQINNSSILSLAERSIVNSRRRYSAIGRLSQHKITGVCCVDFSNVLDYIKRTASNSVMCCESSLPEFIATLQSSLLTITNDGLDLLMQTPQTTRGFISQVKYLSAVSQRREILDNAFEELKCMHEKATELRVHLDEECIAAFSMLKPRVSQFNRLIDAAETSKKDDVHRWTERLAQEIEQFHERVSELNIRSSNDIFTTLIDIREPVINAIDELSQDAKEVLQEAADISHFQEILEAPLANFEVLEATYSAIQLKHDLWHAVHEVKPLVEKWGCATLYDLESEEAIERIISWQKLSSRCTRELPSNDVTELLAFETTRFSRLLPIVKSLQNPKMQERHWAHIEDILKCKIDRDPMTWQEPLTLSYLEKLMITDFSEQILEISMTASQEFSLEEVLNKINQIWKLQEFELKDFKHYKDVCVLAGIESLQEILDDSMLSITNLLSSQFITGIRNQVDETHSTLRKVASILDTWLYVQRDWMYLEPIFSNPDIQRQLPAETRQFAEVDKRWRALMRKVSENPNVVKCTSYQGLRENLQSFGDGLQKVLKCLKQYLESKKQAFPRFFFLSDDELLDIISNSRTPSAVQPHINKCWEGILCLKFGDFGTTTANDIFGVECQAGEHFVFDKDFKARGQVEVWMAEFESYLALEVQAQCGGAAVDCLSASMADCKPTIDLIERHPAQCLILAFQVLFSYRVERSICARSSAVDDTTMQSQSSPRAQLERAPSGPKDAFTATKQDLASLTRIVEQKVDAVQRKKIVSLITLMVHSRDVAGEIYTSKISDTKDFEWQMHLRYYFEAGQIDGNASHTSSSIEGLSIADSTIQTPRQLTSQVALKPLSKDARTTVQQVQTAWVYSNEYLGASSRLVVTPLTDRCYMTLTGAVHLHLGAAPTGPAGTGKTETTKDLAKALGIACIVFNCSEALDHHFMGTFFRGLAQSGFWACFDEFNRIGIEVLSVVAQQVKCILSALAARASRFEFEGIEIRLIKTFGVFITMNPGYAGRTELPDNLKILFRPVSMMIPDYSRVAEVMLFSEGFQQAKSLSVKMVQLYKLASEQLSPQDHYDFGMRAIKSVLVMAGSLKRQRSDACEQDVLILAILDANIPKFLQDDVALFSDMLQDLFPAAEVVQSRNSEIQSAVRSVLEEHRLFHRSESQILKCQQLYQTLMIRFGVMVVGEAGTSKSTCLRALHAAVNLISSSSHMRRDQKQLLQTTKLHSLNPKAIDLHEIYGKFNTQTLEWFDGIVASVCREAMAAKSVEDKHDQSVNTSEEHHVDSNATFSGKSKPLFHWLHFDGPVDALWIENMNSVLDDSQTLCLQNNERLKLSSDRMRMLFEVSDLSSASPATISRCGMVYMSPSTVPLQSIAESYMARHWTEKHSALSAMGVLETICSYVSSSLVPAIDFIKSSGLQFVLKCQQICIVHTCMALIRGMINVHFSAILKAPPGDAELLLQRIVLWSVVWSVGGILNTEGKEAFSEFVRESLGHLTRFPNYGNVFDYYLDSKQIAFELWSELVHEMPLPSSADMSNFIVPTSDTVRYTFVGDVCLSVQRPVLFSGMSGSGKTICLRLLLRDICEEVQTDVGHDQSEGSTGDNAALKDSISENVSLPFNRISKGQLHFKEYPMSATTSSSEVQATIEGNLDQRRKGVLGPQPGSQFIIFIDDVNMPQKEMYGAQPPVELLRMIVDRCDGFVDTGGVYRRPSLEYNTYEDVHIVAAGGIPGGGRSQLSTRFSRHFGLFSLESPSEGVMLRIFATFFSTFMPRIGHSQNMQQIGNQTADACVRLFEETTRHFRPTPSRHHYLFNLRDLLRVVFGMLTVKPKQTQSKLLWAHLWVWETSCSLKARLLSSQEVFLFEELQYDIARRCFQAAGWAEKDAINSTSVWSNFLKPGLDTVDRNLEFVADCNQLVSILDSILDEYNVHHPTSKLQMIFFQDCIVHICRTCRVMSQNSGHALLVGLGGSGRLSVTRIASYLCDLRVLQPELKQEFSISDFRDFVKEVYLLCGQQMIPCCMALADAHLVNDTILQDVNLILGHGDVPGLFDEEDTDKVVSELRKDAIKAGYPGSTGGIMSFFISRVKKNCHVVLNMSPVGAVFKDRCRRFPALINCCNIDWFWQWPSTALRQVAKAHIAKMTDMESLISSSDSKDGSPIANQAVDLCWTDNVSAILVENHSAITDAAESYYKESRKRVYTTPSIFLDCLTMYRRVVGDLLTSLIEKITRFESGLRKLAETNDRVATMQAELNALQPELVRKTTQTQELISSIAVDEQQASQIRETVLQETQVVQLQTQEVESMRVDAQHDLDEALPALESAIQALNDLTKGDLVELKSFTSPPALVRTVMEAVCLLLGEKQDWDSAKKVLGDPNLMKRLLEYDRDNIASRVLKSLKKFLEEPEFNAHSIGKVSKAAKGLAMWVIAVDVYARVSKEVEPKRERLRQADEELSAQSDALQRKQMELQDIEDQVQQLQDKLAQSKSDEQQLKAQAAITEKRIGNASKLILSMADEEKRWSASKNELLDRKKKLVGDALVAAICIAYTGPFGQKQRVDMLPGIIDRIRRRSIDTSDSVSLSEVLSSSVERREWAISGLPADNQSVENAVILRNSLKWPLLIDPQQQAIKWLQKMLGQTGAQTISATSSRCIRAVESCLQAGVPILVEDVREAIDPALNPVLDLAASINSMDSSVRPIGNEGSRNSAKAKRTMIKFGDRQIVVDHGFKLFLITKLPKPEYLPDVFIRTAVLNFSVTEVGLEDQLLARVVQHERADLEDMKDRLTVSMAEDDKQLHLLQEKVLVMLADSKGNVLDNEELISTLSQSKLTASVLKTRFEESQETNQSISKTRNLYKPVSSLSTKLFFVISGLQNIDPMYQFSLEYFIQLFDSCLTDSVTHPGVDQRIQNISTFTVAHLFKTISRSLFEDHQLCFSFLMAVAKGLQDVTITPELWQSYVRCKVVHPPNASKTNLPPQMDSSLSNASGKSLAILTDCLSLFDSLAIWEEKSLSCTQSLQSNAADWKRWLALPAWTPADGFPGQCDSLPHFCKVVLVSLCKESSVLPIIQDFILHELGNNILSSTSWNLSSIFPETNRRIPVLLTCAPGADASSDLEKFAHAHGMADRVFTISLGQGQGPVAERAIQAAAASGDWVFLLNCHLAESWLPSLEEIVENINLHYRSYHENFRLYITSAPTTAFPISILQKSLKLAYESPRGLKSNVVQSLHRIGEQHWNSMCQTASQPEIAEARSQVNHSIQYSMDRTICTAWTKLQFALCCFHALVLERRRFGALGFNIQYGFDTADFDAARLNLQAFIETFGEQNFPWKAASYIIGNINYGGRVTDDWDRKALLCILDRCISKEAMYGYDGVKLFRPCSYGSRAGQPSHTVENETDSGIDLSTLHDLSFSAAIDVASNCVNDSLDPSTFGMHENAGLIVRAKQAKVLLSDVLAVQSNSSSMLSTGPDEDTSLKEQLLAAVPRLVDTEPLKSAAWAFLSVHQPISSSVKADLSNQAGDKRVKNPLWSVLMHECHRMNNLLSVIEKQLHNLGLALEGEIAMSAELEAVLLSARTNTVPKPWERAAYPSMKPLSSWMIDLAKRVHSLRTWVQFGPPKSFWLPGLFYPQGFLSALLQRHARLNRLAIDSLTFAFKVTTFREGSQIPSEAQEGAFVHGLFLESAAYDSKRRKLTASLPGHTHSPVPVIQFVPRIIADKVQAPPERQPSAKARPSAAGMSPADNSIRSRTPSSLGSPGAQNKTLFYDTPLYKTSARAGILSTTGQSTNFVIAVSLPTSEPPASWTLQGVCLLCQLDE